MALVNTNRWPSSRPTCTLDLPKFDDMIAGVTVLLSLNADHSIKHDRCQGRFRRSWRGKILKSNHNVFNPMSRPGCLNVSQLLSLPALVSPSFFSPLDQRRLSWLLPDMLYCFGDPDRDSRNAPLWGLEGIGGCDRENVGSALGSADRMLEHSTNDC